MDALRQDPGDTATMLDLADLLAEMGRIDESGEKIRRAIEIQPDHPAAFYSLGRWHALGLRDDEAETALRRTIELDPTYPGAHLLLAQVYQRQKRLPDARRHLRAELLLRPENPRILMDLANHLIDLGDTRPALACLKRLVQVDSTNAQGWQNLAVVQFLRERYDEGILSSQECLRLDPQNSAALHNLAMAYGQMHEYDQALRHLRSALAKSPKDVALQRLELRLHLNRFTHNVRRVVNRLLGR
jgi:tetratricopeptide (TPR) repeat protein